MRRTAAIRTGRVKTTLSMIKWFFLAITCEGVHPLEAGVFRFKFRRDRRHGMPLENPVRFYARYAGELVGKLWTILRFHVRCRKILGEVLNAPDRWTYADVATTRPQAEEFASLDLYNATRGGEQAMARERRAITAAAR